MGHWRVDRRRWLFLAVVVVVGGVLVDVVGAKLASLFMTSLILPNQTEI